MVEGLARMESTEVVLINPGDKRQVYQSLSGDLVAIEPPYWAAAIATFLRNNGISVRIIDANAENYSCAETTAAVAAIKPLLAAVIVYGSQPSASTQNMTIAGNICRAIREKACCKVAMGGLHPSALPKRTMFEESVDFVIQGEGPYTLKGLMEQLRAGSQAFDSIPGLWYREEGAIVSTTPAPLIHDLDTDLPQAAWDLLPMQHYRAHNWHCFDDLTKRQPYAAIYTSLGCPYSCAFCCINALFGKAGIRYRSPQSVVAEIGLLVEQYGVKNLKIIDELFVLNERHYMTIVDLLIEKGYDLNIWAYARVDTVNEENLSRMKHAGIKWLALGIETANPDVRNKSAKQMRIMDIRNIVDKIHAAGIHIIANYIFGLPGEDMSTMQETLDLAMDLNCEFANMYCAMAYPGSNLYDMALEEGWPLPEDWHGYSQHSYEMVPLPTKRISAREVLMFRDNAFHAYFENPHYLNMMEKKFGYQVREHLEEMTKTRLKRKILGD